MASPFVRVAARALWRRVSDGGGPRVPTLRGRPPAPARRLQRRPVWKDAEQRWQICGQIPAVCASSRTTWNRTQACPPPRIA
eukprot:7604900-Lingulodinium_polyedra.AAC.1